MGLIQHPQQGSLFLLGAEGLRQLQIPPGIHIQFHKSAGSVVLQLADMCQIVFLEGQKSLQQTAAGHNGLGKSCKAQVSKTLAEVFFQYIGGGLHVKLFLPALIYTAAEAVEQCVLQDLFPAGTAKAQHFRGGETAQFRCGGGGVGADCGEKRACGDVAEGKTDPSAVGVQTAHIVITTLVQHTAFRDGAGGDDPGDVSLHDALGLSRILHLLADGYLVALLHQPGDVGVHGVIGHTAHRGLLFLGLVPVPGGQGQIQFPGGKLGILVKHLIKVAQTEEQDTVLVLFLDLEILPSHRGHFSRVFRHRDTPS